MQSTAWLSCKLHKRVTGWLVAWHGLQLIPTSDGLIDRRQVMNVHNACTHKVGRALNSIDIMIGWLMPCDMPAQDVQQGMNEQSGDVLTNWSADKSIDTYQLVISRAQTQPRSYSHTPQPIWQAGCCFDQVWHGWWFVIREHPHER